MRAVAVVSLLALFVFLSADNASAASCFGKQAQVVTNNGSYHLKRGQAVFLAARKARVKAAGDNRICARKGDYLVITGKGRQNKISLGSGNDRVVVAGAVNTNQIRTGAGNDQVIVRAKANRQLINTGAGHDRVIVNRKAKAKQRIIRSGLGNDFVNLLAVGNTTTYLSPVNNPRNLSDYDTFYGNDSNDIVYDYHGGDDLRPNYINGRGGVDRLYSLKSARSDLYGGHGSDFLYSSSTGVSGDRLIGGRGNDKLFANQARAGQKVYGAFLDGNQGDDWFYGSSADDTIIALSGIKKIYAGDGDDFILKTGDGIGTIEGGNGRDTISYIAHTPPGYRTYSGVMVNLEQNQALNGKGIDTIHSVENVIGSAFDDLLTGNRGISNILLGGMGDDNITATSEDYVDGGLGVNTCLGGKQTNCNQLSPGTPDANSITVEAEHNILTIIGSKHSDTIKIGYDPLAGGYLIDSSRQMNLSTNCSYKINKIFCPAQLPLLSLIVVDGQDGDDLITVDNTVPADVNAILSGGKGHDTIYGGNNKDVISDTELAYGRGNDDQIFHTPGAKLYGGAGGDTFHITSVCSGGAIHGGAGKDNAVFAGATYGVDANLQRGDVRWRGQRPCSNPVALNRDLESLEGSRHADTLTGFKHKATAFLGREGADIFNARNGVRDVITTGGGGESNTVRADRIDKVIWGWGYAAY